MRRVLLFNGFTTGTLVIPMNNTVATGSIPSAGSMSSQAATDQVLQAIVSSVIKDFPINAYFGFILAVLLLGIFASVGYKIAKLGIELIDTEKHHENHSTKEATTPDNVKDNE